MHVDSSHRAQGIRSGPKDIQLPEDLLEPGTLVSCGAVSATGDSQRRRLPILAPKVLVLTLDWPQSAYLMVALREAGLEAKLLTTAPPDRLGLGRYCEQITAPSHRRPEYVEWVLREISRSGATLLLPVCEPLIELCWQHERRWPVPVYPATEYWQRAVLLDRRLLYETAATAGVRVAPWMPLARTADVREAARSFGLPMVIRGTHGYGGTQVRIVDSEEKAVAAYEELLQRSRGEPFAQAFVQGRRCLFGALFERGEPLRWFAQETLEAYPLSTSPSIRVRSVTDERLNGYARALFRALKWDGLACAEFIREDTGDYSLLEVNPRPWTAIQAAQYCGIDLFQAFAEHLAGRPITSATQYQPGIECALFPQFLLARVNAAKLSSWRDVRYGLQSLRAAPWGRPRLMFHMARRVIRYLRGIIPEQ